MRVALAFSVSTDGTSVLGIAALPALRLGGLGGSPEPLALLQAGCGQVAESGARLRVISTSAMASASVTILKAKLRLKTLLTPPSRTHQGSHADIASVHAAKQIHTRSGRSRSWRTCPGSLPSPCAAHHAAPLMLGIRFFLQRRLLPRHTPVLCAYQPY